MFREKSFAEETEKEIMFTKDGKITFSRDVIPDLLGFRYVDLYWEPDKKQIGIEPLDFYGSEDSFKIKGIFNLHVDAKLFFEHFEISVPVGEYEYTLDRGMLIVQLVKGEE
jgi:hypothetical protein